MLKILVLLAMFVSPLIAVEEPHPRIPKPEVTAIPAHEAPEPPAEPVIEPIPEMPIEEIAPEVTPEPIIEEVSEVIEEPDEIPTISGCTDSRATNYIPSDENWNVVEDGSCYYLEGCTDSQAVNYFDGAVKDDGSCCYLICDSDGFCDTSDINPNKKPAKPHDEDDSQPVFIPTDEPEELEFSFDLGNCFVTVYM